MLHQKSQRLPLIRYCIAALVTAKSLSAAKTLDFEPPSDKPNILFIMSDDVGWRDLSAYGSDLYETPHLDRFAREGMRFTKAYSSSPLCSPTRASVLTGQYPARLRFTLPNGHFERVVLDPSESETGPATNPAATPQTRSRLPNEDYQTIAETLQKEGYATALIGKWHLGRRPHIPENQGFDLVLGGRYDSGPPKPGGFFAPWRLEGDTLPEVEGNEHISDVLAAEVVKTLQGYADSKKPFFLCYWPYDVHAPFQAKEELIAKYERKLASGQYTQDCPIMGGMMETLDTSIGSILKGLESAGLSENTIVVFYSDNGGNMYDRIDGTTPTNNAPLRAGKGNNYEGGVRVPLIVRWPGVIRPGSEHSALITSSDFYPTFLELLGLPLLPKVHVDGHSFLPALQGKIHQRPEPIFSHFPHYMRRPGNIPNTSLLDGSWKLYRFWFDGPARSHRYELYNLDQDIGETYNLASKYPERVTQMDSKIDSILKSTKALLPRKNQKYDSTARSNDPAKKSGKPASAKKKSNTISIKAYGAVPDDGRNDFPAIRQAIESAVKEAPAVIQFEPGKYILDSENGEMAQHQLFKIAKAESIVLEGNGATFEVRNPDLGFLALDGCGSIQLRNFSIDYKPLTFSTGKIIEVDPQIGQVIIDLLPGSPAPDSAKMKNIALRSFMSAIDPKRPGRLAAGVNNFFRLESIDRINEKRFDIRTRSEFSARLKNVKPGYMMSILSRAPMAQLFSNYNCKGLEYEDITVLSSPELVFVFVDSEDISLNGCQVLVKAGRFKSANGDGIHAQNCRGPIVIEDCRFEGLSDDAINLYSKMAYIEDAGPRENEFILLRKIARMHRKGAGKFHKGDKVYFYDLRKGKVIHETSVLRAETDDRLVALESAPLDASIESNDNIVLFNQGYTQDVKIIGNTFLNHRRFGIFIKGSDIEIRDNRFEGLSGSAIMVSYEAHYHEAGFSGDVLIENNSFKEIGFDREYMGNEFWNTITVFPSAVDAFNGLSAIDPDLTSAWNIRIRGNEFHDETTRILLGHIENLEVSHNRFSSPLQRDRGFVAPITIRNVSNFQCYENKPFQADGN